MDWQEIYKQRLTTPAEAMKVVRSGDTVMVPIFPPATLAPRARRPTRRTERRHGPPARPGG